MKTTMMNTVYENNYDEYGGMKIIMMNTVV